MQSLRAFRSVISIVLAALVVRIAAQNGDRRLDQLRRTLGAAARMAIDYARTHTSEYDEWLVEVANRLKVSDGFSPINVPDNVLELWSFMSEDNPLVQLEQKIDELTPMNVRMPEEEKLMVAVVSRYIWDKLQHDQYDHEATDTSLTLTFTLTYEEIMPPYLAMTNFLSSRIRV